MDDEIISKLEARAAGLRWYFTGKACRKGHVTKRSTAHGECRGCSRERGKIRWAVLRRPPRPVLSPDEKLERQRRSWRESYRRRKGGRPLDEFRAEQKTRKDTKAAERATKAAAKTAERSSRKAASHKRQREKQAAWREANRDRARELVRRWKEANREKVRAAKRSRRASKRITLVRELTKLQRGRCAYCRVKLDKLHVDHVMPLKLGGPDHRSNLQITCEPCNLTKSAKDPIVFARSTGRLL
jgi:5-methylcytosine-specific restriction endonuclease McrA